jgi:hypothetical protein
MKSAYTEKEHAFWRRLVLPQEERCTAWRGTGYRWFRSPNIICLEHYRAKPAAARPIIAMRRQP